MIARHRTARTTGRIAALSALVAAAGLVMAAPATAAPGCPCNPVAPVPTSTAPAKPTAAPAKPAAAAPTKPTAAPAKPSAAAPGAGVIVVPGVGAIALPGIDGVGTDARGTGSGVKPVRPVVPATANVPQRPANPGVTIPDGALGAPVVPGYLGIPLFTPRPCDPTKVTTCADPVTE